VTYPSVGSRAGPLVATLDSRLGRGYERSRPSIAGGYPPLDGRAVDDGREDCGDCRDAHE
jgi:hypothetical protein